MTLTRKVLLVLSVSALFMGPVAPSLHIGDLDAAYAKEGRGGGGGNGGGNGGGGGNSGGGHGGGKSEGGKSGGASERGNGGNAASERAAGGVRSAGRANGNGSAASELKGLNAAHASAQALASASPNSRVGRIATYLGATEAAMDAQVEFDRLNGLDTADLAKAFPPTTHDEAAYQAALAAADAGDPDRLRDLLALTEEIAAEFTVIQETGEQIFDDAAYEKAIEDASPSADYMRLARMSDEEKFTVFPDSNGYDDAAYQAALDAAKAGLDAAEADAEASLVAAGGSADLSDEARAYLARLLDGKTLSDDQETVVEEILATQG